MAKFRHTKREFALGISVYDDSEAIIRLIDPDTDDVKNHPGDVAIQTSDPMIVTNMSRMLDSLWKRSTPLERAISNLAAR
jgi:hypothetical protein